MSDARAAEARRHHREAAKADAAAASHRDQRDRLIRGLAGDGWSYGRIAKAVQCSPELIAYIIKRKSTEQEKQA